MSHPPTYLRCWNCHEADGPGIPTQTSPCPHIRVDYRPELDGWYCESCFDELMGAEAREALHPIQDEPDELDAAEAYEEQRE
ncbi:MAG TPA: hypothetical protein VIV15_12245 [Anaerolineales bacterium]